MLNTLIDPRTAAFVTSTDVILNAIAATIRAGKQARAAYESYGEWHERWVWPFVSYGARFAIIMAALAYTLLKLRHSPSPSASPCPETSTRPSKASLRLEHWRVLAGATKAPQRLLAPAEAPNALFTPTTPTPDRFNLEIASFREHFMSRTVAELRSMARELGVVRVSRLRKAELVEAILRAC